MTWMAQEPSPKRLTAAGWLRALLRGAVLVALLYGGLVLMLVLRLIERPLHGLNRPWTPYITQVVCRLTFPVLGLGYRVRGRPMEHIGAVVANHGSWLDIFALNACQTLYFVSKAEVARWPMIGWLARATGTVFIRRDPREAKLHQQLFEDRLRAGHHLLFFPEGTSTDTRRVLSFKPTLFAAFFSHGLERILQIQPVTLIYHPPPGEDVRFYGWWGEMGFGPHLLKVLAQRRQGSVEIVFHDPLDAAQFTSRKALALRSEEAVRAGLPYADETER
ncbi:lysophospholipid acyltransferase family protein [Thioclava sp. 15-R06ZXC-3]|uniref:Lysophospholipid acyltransferase family protein n=1 Tax=Thioclava arctica TaxID=3238301 RepID=A0ABV3TRV5_9RHOB